MLWLLEVPGISQGPHPECLPRESAAYTLMSAVVTIVDLAGSGDKVLHRLLGIILTKLASRHTCEGLPESG